MSSLPFGLDPNIGLAYAKYKNDKTGESSAVDFRIRVKDCFWSSISIILANNALETSLPPFFLALIVFLLKTSFSPRNSSIYIIFFKMDGG